MWTWCRSDEKVYALCVFSRDLGEDDMEELERELQHLERWEFPTDEKLAKFEEEFLK